MICGDSEDVAQVSITSGSPMKPPGWPRWASVKPGGTSEDGSTGSASSAGVSGSSYLGSPVSDSGYQTGNGTPKKRCRLISQSPVSPPTQCSYRCRMWTGTQSSCRPAASSCSRRISSRPPLRRYHWRLLTISSGSEPRS